MSRVVGIEAERRMAGEVTRLRWPRAELEQRPKSTPERVALAARLQREMTLTIRELAARLYLRGWRSHHPAAEPETDQTMPCHVGIVLGGHVQSLSSTLCGHPSDVCV